MDFLKETNNDATRIRNLADKELNVWREKAKKIDPELGELMGLFIKAFGNGKTIRGLLVVLGFDLAGGDKNKDIYKIAAAYEIFHTAILIHDDIIDNSKTRRGEVTIHERFRSNGKELAICLGDIGFFLATELITQTNFDSGLIIDALNYSSRVKINTAFGEILDILKKDPITVAKLKTARYSISGPLVLGSKLASVSKIKIKALETFGENLGIAYQIRDDILGVFGDEKALGKSVASDIEDGKNTLLFEYAFKNANANQKKSLLNKYGRGKVNKSDLEGIRDIFRSTGALEYADGEVLKYATSARKQIHQITAQKKYQIIMEQFCRYILERTK